MSAPNPPIGPAPPPPPPPPSEPKPSKPAPPRDDDGALKYEAPDWAAKSPFPGLRLEVFKAGQFIAKVKIDDKLCLVLGRQSDAVDVLLEHGSISRRHAVVVHGSPDSKKSGPCATLLDLNSANGSFVKSGTNRKPVVPEQPLKLEEGMCLEFGESSRSYYVRGLSSPKEDTNAENMAGSKRKYTEGGYLANDDHLPLAQGTGKRLKPKEHWEQTASAFGNNKAKHNKFLRLLGGKKKNKKN